MSQKRIKKEINNQSGNTKFGQDRRRHSKRGVIACLFAVTGLVALVGLLGVAYYQYGNGHTVMGAISMLSLMLSILGVVNGIRGFREREKNYVTCKIGIGVNIFIIICFTLLYIRGLR